ncbi:MAG: GNAT family N-acetyltransferase [Rubrivivax sp.]|nr:GNAT family N-acetyltransferase [Rubrivivax sp.]
MNVARLQPSDAMRYRTLMLEAYELAADAFTSTANERASESETYWIKRIADPAGISLAFGAFEGQELIGTVALEFSAKPKTRHKALVIGMYVKPQARGRGAGGALLQAAVQHAKSQDGILLLTLTATEGNEPAINLYRTAGFEVFGTEPLAILTPSGYKAKVHMWLPLADARTAA